MAEAERNTERGKGGETEPKDELAGTPEELAGKSAPFSVFESVVVDNVRLAVVERREAVVRRRRWGESGGERTEP